jgi:hypothetical protein
MYRFPNLEKVERVAQFIELVVSVEMSQVHFFFL